MSKIILISFLASTALMTGCGVDLPSFIVNRTISIDPDRFVPQVIEEGDRAGEVIYSYFGTKHHIFDPMTGILTLHHTIKGLNKEGREMLGVETEEIFMGRDFFANYRESPWLPSKRLCFGHKFAFHRAKRLSESTPLPDHSECDISVGLPAYEWARFPNWVTAVMNKLEGRSELGGAVTP